ncbi:MAG: leucine-rich repeat protein, partial [Ruminococcus sp.]|nr:leucine-rich repeat protein [Ruminococcus sp.]
ISLSEIHIPASVAEIDWRAFYGDHFRIITVDNNNSCYDSREDCSALIETATDTLIKGSENAFIPDTVKAIHHFAFDGLNTITSITIPDSVTSIGNHAIYDCTSLKSVTIPASVTSIGDYAIGYYYGIIYQSKWVTEYGEKKISGFTIKGYNDTEAQRYAQSNGITFISLGEKPTEAPTEPPVLLGDADGNGEVDLVDATVIQRHTTMIAVPYDEAQLMCADIDDDGSLTIVDATFIQRYATKVQTPYKIGATVG